MQGNKKVCLSIKGITVVLLCGAAFAASADQMMLKVPASPKPVPAPTSLQRVPATGVMQLIAVPAAAQPSAVAPAPPSQDAGKGMIYQSPAMACASNSTPRISSINGMQSGIQFKPGATLNIAGCGFGGFGKGGHVTLSGVGNLIVDGWDDANIHAHINPAISGVSDRVGTVKLIVAPNGAPTISSPVAYSFRANRESIQVALPSNRAIFSQVYNGIKATSSPDGKSTIVERGYKYDAYCPPVTSQYSQMQDVWAIDGLLNDGFEVVGVNYQNQTDQKNADEQFVQYVIVGDNGGAVYDAELKRIIVTFQGHSAYAKKVITEGGYSWCTSRYTASLTLRGPAGVAMWFK